MGTSKIRAEIKFGARKPYSEQDEWQRGANGYTVTLRCQGRQLTTDYWTGSAWTTEPTAADVLASLLSDASLGEETFSEFCAGLGYDEDSRRARSAWATCVATGPRLRRLLGDAYEALSQRGADPSDFETDDEGNVLVRA